MASKKLRKRLLSCPSSLEVAKDEFEPLLFKGPLPSFSRPALKRLKAQIDFDRDELRLFEEGIRIPLKVNEAGQYVVPLMDPVDKDVLVMEPQPPTPAPAPGQTGEECLADVWDVQGDKVVRIHREPRNEPYYPDDSCPFPISQLLSNRCTHVIREPLGA